MVTRREVFDCVKQECGVEAVFPWSKFVKKI